MHAPTPPTTRQMKKRAEGVRISSERGRLPALNQPRETTNGAIGLRKVVVVSSRFGVVRPRAPTDAWCCAAGGAGRRGGGAADDDAQRRHRTNTRAHLSRTHTRRYDAAPPIGETECSCLGVHNLGAFKSELKRPSGGKHIHSIRSLCAPFLRKPPAQCTYGMHTAGRAAGRAAPGVAGCI